MHLIRTLRRTGLVFAAGATTAYFLDPEVGPDRRSRIIERVRGLSAARGQATELEATLNDAQVSSPRESAPADAGTPTVKNTGSSPSGGTADGVLLMGSTAPDDDQPDFPPRMESEGESRAARANRAHAGPNSGGWNA